jgi:large repetitive protein
VANIALADLIIPYLLRANNLGANHAALAAIRVTSFETASDIFGMVIRGKAEINGQAFIDVQGGRLTVASATSGAAPPFDPTRKSPIFDIRETEIEFELFVPRAGSAIIFQGASTITAAGFAPTQNVLNVWDAPPLNPAPSDYPSSAFTFDFIIKAPSIRPPFFQPAKMTDRGLLVPDPSFQEVALHLPKLRFRLTHGNALNSQLNFQLVSAGVDGLDDPGDIAVAELISMEPPYAFIGGPQDRVIGFGFRKAVLDLSANSTPPAVVEKFGFGDDWSGLYLPEARIFVALDGAQNLAIEAGVEDLLIGFGASAGVSGDIEVAVINQGAGQLKLGARFFDASDKALGIERLTETTARVVLPDQTRMVVDIQGGMPPYTSTLRVNGAAAQNGRLFNIDVSSGLANLVIQVSDATPDTPKTGSLAIETRKRVVQLMLPVPGTQPQPAQPAIINPPATGAPVIKIAYQNNQEVTLTTDPPDASVMWSVAGGPPGETGPAVSFTIPAPADANVAVKARLPGQTVPTEAFFYFYFDEPQPVSPADEDLRLGAYAGIADNLWSTRANSKLRGDLREAGGAPPLIQYNDVFQNLVPNLSALTITGRASHEGDGSNAKRDYNYSLARRRAIAVREVLRNAYVSKNFSFTIDPEPRNPGDYADLVNWTSDWLMHTAPNDREYWKASVSLPPGINRPEQIGNATIKRPTTQPPPVIVVRDPPPPSAPPPPSWFRSAKLKFRMFKGTLIALEVEAEIDFQTAAEDRINASGQAPGSTPSNMRTLQNGAPIAPDNPADGITKFRILAQSDQTSGRITTLVQIGADPADKDGLIAAGWMPGEPPNNNKDGWLTLLGSYISFWPLMVDMTGGNRGAVVDALLTGAALATPAVVAALPWFRVERIILFGGEYLRREQGGSIEGIILFDVEADWSAKISIFGIDLLEIDKQAPLCVRYKAIGIRLGNKDEQGNPGQTGSFSLRPIFDSSRGYTIDIARGGSLKIAQPFDRILKILAARLSRTNPLTFEIDIGVGVDLGVVTIDRARVRVYLNSPDPPELTAFGASVDIAGAIVGRGYMELGQGNDPGTTKIGGQIDVTLRPVSLRIAAAFEISDIIDGSRKVTGVYIGLNIVLPVGIPLGSSGLGLFGFRGIFGMHYQRNTDIGNAAAAPALRWLEATGGQPHLLKNPTTQQILWKPKADQWAFGIGALLGTMEGGVLMNLDGTLLIELPGPRVAIVMNARIISPPPSVDGMGSSGGILAIIEITPDHFFIGIIANYEIKNLIKIRIPVEAYFDFADVTNWHFYLGQRKDPIEVNVLGIVKGTGYFMVRGNGLEALTEKKLPAVSGFALGLGAAASITFGDVDAGLYLRVGGSMDAIIGFDPFMLAGHFELYGELRLFIISIGASAKLDVKVVDKNGIQMLAEGEACGHIDFFFFEVEGCVHVKIGGVSDKPDLPTLVEKLSLKSRSPALAQGTGVDRPIDTSLGDGIEGAAAPAMNDPKLVTVPIDTIPVLSMRLPPQSDGLTFEGKTVSGFSGLTGGSGDYVPRGSEEYQYKVTEVKIERQGGAPALLGSNAPATWWTLTEPTKKTPTAQLALLTYEPEAASKAIEKTETRTESVKHRWGTVCHEAAPAAPVLWTFLFERLGPSLVGWDLEGIAWPDPPDTKRTQAVETNVMVSEQWRTGIAAIDNARGIVPAMVVGSLIRCKTSEPQPATPETFVPGAVAADVPWFRRAVLPTTAAAVSAAVRKELILSPQRAALAIQSSRLADKIERMATVPAQAVDPVSLLNRLALGQSVTRHEMMEGLFAPPSPRDEKRDGTCETRVLQSPMLDTGALIVIGDQRKGDRVASALEKAGIKHGPLDDVVVVHTNAFAEAHVLLFVSRRIIEMKRLVLRVLDVDGNEISNVVVRASDMLAGSPLPAHWTNVAGPWAEDVADVLGWEQDPRASQHAPVIMHLKGSEKADRIEIGVLPLANAGAADRERLLIPNYYLAALEALRFAEMRRADWDDVEVKKEQAAVTKVLGPAGTNDAFLVPNSLYKVTTSWSGKRKSDNGSNSGTQSFWFKTDTQPPTRLDPWMLMTDPYDGEACVFGADPLHLVFNTHDVDRLFAAYGKELRIRLTASSANHPKTKPGIPHPFPINGGTMKPAGAAILSPWEEALEEVIKESAPCIAVDENRWRQSMVTIPIPLDSYTDYKFDVEMVDIGAPASTVGERIYRRSFSTGNYGKLVDFANDLQAVKVLHRHVASGKMEAIRAAFATRKPQGAELDDALRNAGLEAMEPSLVPRLTVFWEQSGSNSPQPAALFVDAPEPMWRERPFPKKEVDNSGPSPATRWIIGQRETLRLEVKPGGAAVVDASGIIRAPGNQRALIVLKAGSRGQRLELDLVRPAVNEAYAAAPEQRVTVVDIPLTKAVWEE